MLHNCIWVMVFAFLLSPFGLQAIAEWLISGVDSINTSLRCFYCKLKATNSWKLWANLSRSLYA
ncbi:MAG: CD1845 family protein [Faecalispora sporosphaeroides]|uniref:CD1845 family protein n=1 Tax=Faecalispora sporosphaeroides TaxID=1549 RepID=UPI002DD663D7|nr:CD1845 family protein [Faecalispora sporosphaeroides]